MTMNNDPANRYARQTQFSPIGTLGQAKLRAAHAAVVGCGALGSVAAELLARAGIGRLTLIDRDVIEWTNLQRQSLYDEQDAATNAAKAEAAAVHLARINGDVTLEPHVVELRCDNIRELLRDVDLVVDGSDNFRLRFLLNDWSLATHTPWVHGGCVGAEGQVFVLTGNTPCFRCLVPEAPPAAVVATCDTAGVIGGASHVIASLQVIEAMKLLTGNENKARSKILSIDFWNNRIRDLSVAPSLSQSCRACAQHQFDYLDGKIGGSEEAVTLCGRETVQIHLSRDSNQFDLDVFAQRWSSLGRVQSTRFFVRIHVDQNTSITLFQDGRALISGTSDPSRARSLYDRFIGS